MVYLFFAYLAIWTALFGYFIHISSRQKKLEREVETLKRLIAEKENKTEK